MVSYITNNFVLATGINSECAKFRSGERQEIKHEKVTENVKIPNVLEQNVKRKRASDDETKKTRAPQYSSTQLTAAQL